MLLEDLQENQPMLDFWDMPDNGFTRARKSEILAKRYKKMRNLWTPTGTTVFVLKNYFNYPDYLFPQKANTIYSYSHSSKYEVSKQSVWKKVCPVADYEEYIPEQEPACPLLDPNTIHASIHQEMPYWVQLAKAKYDSPDGEKVPFDTPLCYVLRFVDKMGITQCYKIGQTKDWLGRKISLQNEQTYKYPDNPYDFEVITYIPCYTVQGSIVLEATLREWFDSKFERMPRKQDYFYAHNVTEEQIFSNPELVRIYSGLIALEL